MEAPYISTRHLRELGMRFPHVFYTWNRLKVCYEVWCDERMGSPPYKFMDACGPGGEYREPGEWILRELRRTDPDTGEYQVGTKAGRQRWIQSLEDRQYLEKRRRDAHTREVEEACNAARYVSGWGRVHGMKTRSASQYRMNRKLGG